MNNHPAIYAFAALIAWCGAVGMALDTRIGRLAEDIKKFAERAEGDGHD